MRTLDRYIVRSFLQSVLLWFAALMMLRVVIDLFVNLDEFTEGGNLSAFELIRMIATHYFLNIFVYFKEMGGIVIVLGAAFAVARMNHTNELTAMLASGVSLHRVVWPIILCAMLMGGLVIVDQEFILPNVRQHLILDADEVATQTKERFQVRFLTDTNYTVWWSPNYDPARKEMAWPLVILRDDRYRYLAHFSGAKAFPGRYEDRDGWVASDAFIERKKTPQNPVNWRTTQDTRRIYTGVGPAALAANARAEYRRKNKKDITRLFSSVDNPRGFDKHFNMRLGAQKFDNLQWSGLTATSGELIRPRAEFLADDDRSLCTIYGDTALWVPGLLHECRWDLDGGRLFHATDLSYKDLELRQNSRWMDFLSSTELSTLMRLRNVPDLRAVRQSLYLRFADPLNNLVMLLLGLPFILSRERNIKASAALCLLFVGVFYVFVYICRYLGLPDFLGAFLPALLFGPVSVLMLDSIKT
ncbi:MAG: LptF/LptG family permease [Phycisphaerae bacterium]|nr:LptF/LptG family permease [Phycisphaerae bacterium]